jgi:hypothetical protein
LKHRPAGTRAVTDFCLVIATAFTGQPASGHLEAVAAPWQLPTSPVDHGAEGTGEPLAFGLRAGDAGSNTVAERQAVIRAACRVTQAGVGAA